MNNLQNEIFNRQKLYRELFLKSQSAIDKKLNEIKRNYHCLGCSQNCNLDFNKIDLFQKLPTKCNFRLWQKAALEMLNNGISKDIYEKTQMIEKYRQTFSCGCCASCCKLASSEFSYEELKKRAQNGDEFSQEFVSIFVPYNSVEQAKKQYPEYIELVEEQYKGTVYYYYCPKIGQNGLCTDYDNRPNICRNFPNNPLVLLPIKCEFNKWKEDVETTALTLNALIDIIGYYKEKLELLK